jgi:hypothetical protein
VEQGFRDRAQNWQRPMKGARVLGVAVLLTTMLAGFSRVAAAPMPAPASWAVLIESNTYHSYANLPVGYINSRRMLTTLIRRGWPSDHILLLRDSPDRAVLHHAIDWLAARARPDDLVVFYVAGEYQFFDKDLMWDSTFPGLWRRIPSSQRVLIVEACYAERLTAAVTGIPGVALPAVGRNELDWWGLRETDRLIRGGTFTYFLTGALDRQPGDMPMDFTAAFATAVAGAQEYFRTVIATTPGALNSFHANGEFPERLATFPNPHLLEEAGTPAAAAAAPRSP